VCVHVSVCLRACVCVCVCVCVCGILQSVAVCGSVLQSVALWCTASPVRLVRSLQPAASV